MRKMLCVLLCFVISGSCCVSADSAEISVSAEACVLLCADDGETYYSKNENKRMKPASTTKILTALLTLEKAKLDNKKVEFRADMISEGSSMYLKVGEIITLRDLAVGILMCSGNDAANAAAIGVAGSREKFAEMMNERARKIGMKNTHFVTPSGLDDPEHYTTAYDMALLMKEALKNPDFAALTAKKSAEVRFTSPADKAVTYQNHNRLLSMYESCIGGKTGYTTAAGRTLVTAARRDGLTLIAVTLNDKNDWDDHIAMYGYGFGGLSLVSFDDGDFALEVPFVGSQQDTVTVACMESCSAVVKKGEAGKIERKIFLDNFLYAPLKKGEVCGRIEYRLDGKTLAVHKIFVCN